MIATTAVTMCTSSVAGPCDNPAVAAVHIHGTTILIRPDHLSVDGCDHWVSDWRCLDCLHHEVDVALGVVRVGTGGGETGE